jgi:hypothetical protein
MARTTSRARAIRAARTITPPAARPDPLQELKDKFTRLIEMRTRIEQSKLLYKAHDELLQELLPSFVTKTDTGFIVRNQITIGDKTFRCHAGFYDPEKNLVVAKKWKSSAFPTFTIEG